MKVNLISILTSNGYEVIKEIDMKAFRLRFTPEEVAKRRKQSNTWGYDLENSFNVEVREVGFDGSGNLYICLDSLGGEDSHFKEGDCFDVIVCE